MTRTVPTVVDLLVAAPRAVVHGGGCCATVTVLPERTVGPVDGALRVYEHGDVVPGLTTQLRDFGVVVLRLDRLAPGWHTLTVAYTGGSRYGCSTAAPFPVLVLPAATTTVIDVPGGGLRPGGGLGVTVCSDAEHPVTGKVLLFERARLLASAELVDGAGTLMVPTDLTPGLHHVFVAYAGSATHSPSETCVVPVTVRSD